MARSSIAFADLKRKISDTIVNEDQRKKCIEMLTEFQEKYLKPREEEDIHASKTFREFLVINRFEDTLQDNAINISSNYNFEEEIQRDILASELTNYLAHLRREEDISVNNTVKLSLLKGRALTVIRGSGHVCKQLGYSRGYSIFLRKFYKLYLRFPFIKNSTESISFFKRNFAIIDSYLRHGRHRPTLDQILNSIN